MEGSAAVVFSFFLSASTALHLSLFSIRIKTNLGHCTSIRVIQPRISLLHDSCISTSQKGKPVLAPAKFRGDSAAARRWGSSLSGWIVVHRGHSKRSHGRLVTGNESKEVRCSVMEVLIYSKENSYHLPLP